METSSHIAQFLFPLPSRNIAVTINIQKNIYNSGGACVLEEGFLFSFSLMKPLLWKTSFAVFCVSIKTSVKTTLF